MTVPDRNTFESAYAGQAPWDIGRPQKAFLDELVRTSGLPATALVEVGNDHRLAEPEPLKAMLAACERAE